LKIGICILAATYLIETYEAADDLDRSPPPHWT